MQTVKYWQYARSRTNQLPPEEHLTAMTLRSLPSYKARGLQYTLRSPVRSESAWQKSAHSGYPPGDLETVSWKSSQNCHSPPSCLGGLRTGSEAFALLKDKLHESSVDKDNRFLSTIGMIFCVLR